MPPAVETNSLRFRVEGMDCAACADKIERVIGAMPDVASVSVSATAGTMVIAAGPDLKAADVGSRVASLGYKALPQPSGRAASPVDGSKDAIVHDHAAESSALDWHSPKVQLVLACGAALVMAFLFSRFAPSASALAYTIAMVIGLIPIARRALGAALAGMPFSIETLMTIAAVGAVIIGASEEAAVVVFLFLIGELLEGYAARRARSSIRALDALLPKTCRVERNGAIVEIDAEQVELGDMLIVRPGDRIAADGEIVSGEGAVNEAPVTGESTPKSKRPGDPVFAGTINADGALRVRVTRTGKDNTIARVIRLVEEAQEAKAPTARFIDRFSAYYTPAVLLLGALTALVPPLMFEGDWSAWIYKGLAVLLIGCPCALVISTPAAIAAGLSAGARRGLLMKGGTVIETVGRLDVIAFDKTGTLTEGRPQVTDVVAGTKPAREVLRLAAALDAGSSHPVAKAVVAHAAAEKLKIVPATDGRAIPGKGVWGKVDGTELFLGSVTAAADLAKIGPAVLEQVTRLQADGKSVSLLTSGADALGLIAVRDEPRTDAREGLARLKTMGVQTIMLSGDNRLTAEAIGKDLGIEPRGGLLPEHKLEIVRDLKAEGRRVGKVGDGINDAPALAEADVGIAMGGGTDVALETADAAVLNGKVGDIADMIELSRGTIRNIWQNITVSLGLKAVFLVTTMVGITGLWPAILADTGATVLVTLNALRLLGFRNSGEQS